MKKHILKQAIRALAHDGLPKEVLSFGGYSDVKVPFICDYGVAYFVYDPQESKIVSITYSVGKKRKIITL